MTVNCPGTLAGLTGRTSAFAAAALLLAGCASWAGDGPSPADGTSEASESSTGGAASSPSPRPSRSEQPNVVEVEISVREGKLTPPPRRVEVEVGQLVRLMVTADVQDEMHVHGFDVSKDVAPGRPTTLEFVADQQGVFEVELELAGLQLVQLQVR